ncbi:kinesin-like protein [Tritrichomonas musculus]|uniref:Kinesin-like protein n=1 Tax=Tritrichomonas musculus TaxID=1915356 RepID=A0ABR2IJT1_9EUKA
MTRIKFTREELLSLFRNDYPIPEGMVQNQPTFVQKAITPKLLSHQTTQYYGNKGSKNPKIKKDINQPPKLDEPIQKPLPKVLKPVITPLAWYYIDPSQTIQGPFQSPMLRNWWEKKLFPKDIKISVSNDKETFKEICEYFPDLSLAFTYNPMLFPFLGKSEYNENDSLHTIFKNFQDNILH